MDLWKAIKNAISDSDLRKQLQSKQIENTRLRGLLEESHLEENRLRERVRELEDVLASPTWTPQA